MAVVVGPVMMEADQHAVLARDVPDRHEGKGEHMDPRFVATSKLLCEHFWNEGDAGVREYTTAELDAIADFSWPWERLQQAIAAGVHALRPRRKHRQPPLLPGIARPQTHVR